MLLYKKLLLMTFGTTLVVEEQLWLPGRGCDSRVVRVESQLDMVGWSRHLSTYRLKRTPVIK